MIRFGNVMLSAVLREIRCSNYETQKFRNKIYNILDFETTCTVSAITAITLSNFVMGERETRIVLAYF